jgi:glyoxylase-like metal-dependent hydrolase (beta-lactamase superfamily II)
MNTQLLSGLHRFEDTCNVYVVVADDGRSSAAIDFGSGEWLAEAARLGLPPLRHVFLTHHHADQCRGLSHLAIGPLGHLAIGPLSHCVNDSMTQWLNGEILVHAPPGERAFLEPDSVAEFWRTRREGGVPRSYSVVERGVASTAAAKPTFTYTSTFTPTTMDVVYDMGGWTDLFWGSSRVRFISTPGHGPNATSVLMDIGSKQVLFCGDAAHAGGTIWQPYHLEWDHWTGAGALQAWEGVERLLGVHIDLLCPSHGPVVASGIRRELTALSRRLLDLARAKGSICAGERDGYLPPRFLNCGAREVLPGLIQFGANSYLLLSQAGEGLVIDPWSADIGELEPLLDELGRPRVTAGTATHYHLDHSDGLPILRERHGARVWLHPQVAGPLREIGAMDVPWLPKQPVIPDALLPEDGEWTWNEYAFRVAHFPGQTWGHCALMAAVDDRRVFFGGDSFQPPSRWNGTGGFCAYNGSRFRDGFVRSARMVMDWRPDVVACGHQTYVAYNPKYYRKVIVWANRAEQAVRALCPSGDLERDYHSVADFWPEKGRVA